MHTTFTKQINALPCSIHLAEWTANTCFNESIVCTCIDLLYGPLQGFTVWLYVHNSRCSERKKQCIHLYLRYPIYHAIKDCLLPKRASCQLWQDWRLVVDVLLHSPNLHEILKERHHCRAIDRKELLIPFLSANGAISSHLFSRSTS